jgi:hypothetical protein
MCLYERDTGFRSIGFEVELILNRLRNAMLLRSLTEQEQGSAETESAGECGKRIGNRHNVDAREEKVDDTKGQKKLHLNSPDEKEENRERQPKTGNQDKTNSSDEREYVERRLRELRSWEQRLGITNKGTAK